MREPFDLVIRGGNVIDGSGAPAVMQDIAIRDGRIEALGTGLGPAREEIDAVGQLVTPGFVDIHTHYDGQATWENRLVPSSAHGVTTAILGNCGVGFAPCRPDQRELLIRLMEGVEDIPHPVLAAGLPWTWETLPEYFDLLASRQYDMDIGGYIPHAALRVYVMGERGANREPATGSDIEHMASLVSEAMDAGALGFATSRTLYHRSSDGAPIPTLSAGDDELLAVAATLKRCGKGTIQMVGDFGDADQLVDQMCLLAEHSGRPLTFSLGAPNRGPYIWPRVLDRVAQANAAGLTLKAQVMPRAIGMILGHELTLNPFYSTPTYLTLADVPLAERLQALRSPDIRTRILGESVDANPNNALGTMVRNFNDMFLLGDPPNYEPQPEHSIAAMAARAGVTPESLAYDLLLEGEHGSMLYLAFANFPDGKLDDIATMLRHPDVVPGLGDGGAHCGTICDGSFPTFMLTHWVRDRDGARLSLPQVVKGLTFDTASIVGLNDRGLIAPGRRADINIIDFDRLTLHPPIITHDLPAAGRRLVQRADGYTATLVNGVPVYRNGEHTGALPGRLVRGPQGGR